MRVSHQTQRHDMKMHWINEFVTPVDVHTVRLYVISIPRCDSITFCGHFKSSFRWLEPELFDTAI